MIEHTIDPFSNHLIDDTNLYCIADGKKIEDNIKKQMLNVFVLGKEWKDEFVKECLDDPTRFEKPIKRRKVSNFASTAIKIKLQCKDAKVVELKITRDLLGRMLYLACTGKLNLEKVVRYPLTPVPLSLANIYGTKKTSPKYKLSKHLEGLIIHTEPTVVNIVLYDAMFIIQSLPTNLPKTFGKLAELVLNIICHIQADEIHFVCDRYDVKSIKNAEQQTRGGNNEMYKINGAEQLCPKDFRHALKSSNFKTELIKFLMDEWKLDRYSDCMKQKKIIFAHEDQCIQYLVSQTGNIEYTEVPIYISSHVEADTRLLFHLNVLSNKSPGQNVAVRATDTDILVLLLYYAQKLNINLWMDLGHSTDNSRRLANITDLAEHIGPLVCKALPGYHALTGCDYTSSFFGKGKVNPLKKAEKNPLYLEGLGRLGENTNFVDDDNLIENYVCSLYGEGKLSFVNEARYKIFMQKYKPNDKEFPLEKIKGMDAGMLPPCKDVLLQKMKRCNFVAYIWKHAHLKDPLENIQPTDHGYREVNGIFIPIWFTGTQIPTILSETMESKDVEVINEVEDSDYMERINDSDYDDSDSDDED